MNTKVIYPMRRIGDTGFRTCSACGQKFTQLGLPRHWDHCAKMIERKRRELLKQVDN